MDDAPPQTTTTTAEQTENIEAEEELDDGDSQVNMICQAELFELKQKSSQENILLLLFSKTTKRVLFLSI